jgi:hypothetical protein
MVTGGKADRSTDGVSAVGGSSDPRNPLNLQLVVAEQRGQVDRVEKIKQRLGSPGEEQ